MCHAEVRKVPTAIGATGSLSRALIQYLDDVASENYITELQKMANLGTARLLRKITNVSVFSMKLWARFLLEMKCITLTFKK